MHYTKRWMGGISERMNILLEATVSSHLSSIFRDLFSLAWFGIMERSTYPQWDLLRQGKHRHYPRWTRLQPQSPSRRILNIGRLVRKTLQFKRLVAPSYRGRDSVNHQLSACSSPSGSRTLEFKARSSGVGIFAKNEAAQEDVMISIFQTKSVVFREGVG